jgi:hypothetical protein
MHDPPEIAIGDLLADRVDRRRPAEREPDGGHTVRLLGNVDHGLPVGDGRGERLLAQHVLVRRQQGLDDLAVQRVRHHDTDGVDVGGVDDGFPVRLRAFVAVPPRGIDGERLVGVSDGDQSHVRQIGIEHRRRGPIAVGVRAPGHPGADHRHSDRRPAHGSSLPTHIHITFGGSRSGLRRISGVSKAL